MKLFSAFKAGKHAERDDGNGDHDNKSHDSNSQDDASLASSSNSDSKRLLGVSCEGLRYVLFRTFGTSMPKPNAFLSRYPTRDAFMMAMKHETDSLGRPVVAPADALLLLPESPQFNLSTTLRLLLQRGQHLNDKLSQKADKRAPCYWYANTLFAQDDLQSLEVEKALDAIRGIRFAAICIDPSSGDQTHRALVFGKGRTLFFALTLVGHDDIDATLFFSPMYENSLHDTLFHDYRQLSSMRGKLPQLHDATYGWMTMRNFTGKSKAQNTKAMEDAIDATNLELAQSVLPAVLPRFVNTNNHLTLAYFLSYAGMWMHNCMAYSEAAVLYNQALRILKSIPEQDNAYQLTDTTYFNLGLAHWSRRRYRDAIEAFRSCADIREHVQENDWNLGDVDMLVKVWMHIGDLYKGVKHGQSHCLHYYRKSLRVWLDHDNVREALDVYDRLFDALDQFGFYYEAEETLKEAIAFLEEKSPNNLEAKANLKFRLGLTHCRLDRNNEAVRTYEEALVAFDNIPGERQNMAKSDCFFNIGVAYRHMNNTRKGIEFYTKALELRKALNPLSASTGMCYRNLGRCYTDLRDHKTARDMHAKAFECMVSEHGENSEQAAESAFSVGLAAHYANLYEEAFSWYLRSKDIRANTDSDDRLQNMALSEYNMALCREHMSMFEQAGAHFLECATIRDQLNERGSDSASVAYEKAARCYLQGLYYDKALHCFTKYFDLETKSQKADSKAGQEALTKLEASRQYQTARCLHGMGRSRDDVLRRLKEAVEIWMNMEEREHSESIAMGSALHLMASIHMSFNLNRAMKLFKEGLHIFLENLDDDDLCVAKTLLSMAACHYRLGEFHQAEEVVLQARDKLAIIYEQNFTEDTAICQRLLGLIYLGRGEAKKALQPIMAAMRYYVAQAQLKKLSPSSPPTDPESRIVVSRVVWCGCDVADVLERLGRFAESIEELKEAERWQLMLSSSEASVDPAIQNRLGCLAYMDQDYSAAFQRFSAGLNTYAAEPGDRIDQIIYHQLRLNRCLCRCLLGDTVTEDQVEACISFIDEQEHYQPECRKQQELFRADAHRLRSMFAALVAHKPEVAMSESARAYDIVSRLTPSPQIDLAECVLFRGVAAKVALDLKRAESDFAKSTDLFEATLGKSHPRTQRAAKFARLARRDRQTHPGHAASSSDLNDDRGTAAEQASGAAAANAVSDSSSNSSGTTSGDWPNPFKQRFTSLV